jgi:hypothetical protein
MIINQNDRSVNSLFPPRAVRDPRHPHPAKVLVNKGVFSFRPPSPGPHSAPGLKKIAFFCAGDPAF